MLIAMALALSTSEIAQVAPKTTRTVRGFVVGARDGANEVMLARCSAPSPGHS